MCDFFVNLYETETVFCINWWHTSNIKLECKVQTGLPVLIRPIQAMCCSTVTVNVFGKNVCLLVVRVIFYVIERFVLRVRSREFAAY